MPGVTEINSIGGFAKGIRLRRFRSGSLRWSNDARHRQRTGRNNANVGAGYIEKSGEQYLIRAPGQVQSLEDIRNVILGSSSGVPIRVRDVADVGIGRELRTGAATENGREVVLRDCLHVDRSEQSDGVASGRQEDGRDQPKSSRWRSRRHRLRPHDTGRQGHRDGQDNLLEGAILVIAILFLFLGNIRAAIITATVIPLSMLFTFTGMVITR